MGKKKKKKRAQRKMAASLLPAVRSVEGGDGSAPCSPAKPNTSPGSAATFEAAALSQSCGHPEPNLVRAMG